MSDSDSDTIHSHTYQREIHCSLKGIEPSQLGLSFDDIFNDNFDTINTQRQPRSCSNLQNVEFHLRKKNTTNKQSGSDFTSFHQDSLFSSTSRRLPTRRKMHRLRTKRFKNTFIEKLVSIIIYIADKSVTVAMFLLSILIPSVFGMFYLFILLLFFNNWYISPSICSFCLL